MVHVKICQEAKLRHETAYRVENCTPTNETDKLKVIKKKALITTDEFEETSVE